jgi:hypothetical protein
MLLFYIGQTRSNAVFYFEDTERMLVRVAFPAIHS